VNKEDDKFSAKVREAIIANNEFGILEVSNLESIKSQYFDKDEYEIISKLIRDNSIELLKEREEKINEGFEFLDVMLFEDQNKKRFAVTVYDSNELWQDPQVIEIFLIGQPDAL
jgi:hypothetical protein